MLLYGVLGFLLNGAKAARALAVEETVSAKIIIMTSMMRALPGNRVLLPDVHLAFEVFGKDEVAGFGVVVLQDDSIGNSRGTT